MKRKNTLGKKQKIQIAIAAVLALAGIAFVVYVCSLNSYSTVFAKGTTINGIKVAGLTPEEAEAKVKKSNYMLTLQFRDNQKETIEGKEFELHYENKHNFQELLDKQNGRSLIYKVLGKDNETYTLDAKFSVVKLKKRLFNMPELKKKNMIAPKDAKPVYKKKGFVIQQEVLGTKLDRKDVYKAVVKAVKKGDRILDLESFYDSPKVFSDDKKLTKQIPTLDKLVGTQITYILPGGKKEVLNGTKLMKWLVKDKKGNYTKNEIVWNTKLVEYVHLMAVDIDSTYKARTFHTTGGTDITLLGTGYYGWEIDEAKEVEQLKEDLKSKKHEKREPVYLRREAADPDDNNGFGDTYVEINLGAQHLWVYQKGKIVFETDVVSGKDDAKHRTPAGSFTAMDRRMNKMMRGDRKPNGEYEYETLAKYWIRLTNSGVGLHDAPWRGAFGGNIWRRGGSHGCINLPASAAQTIYGLVFNGTPVAVYY